MNTIKQALERIKWRFENGKFIPNDNDCNALNFIVDWINNEKKQIVKDNVLLTKCYVLLLEHETIKFQEVNFASKQLNKKLHKVDLEQIFEEFRDYLNLLEYQTFLKKHGLKINHPAEMTDEERLIEKNILKEHQAEFMRATVTGKWTTEQIKLAIINQLTELIKLK
ncbi:hypothetical protein [Planktosalinus lacus]|nr:hypothetical protein [Planktosalinus lacus]